MAIAGGQVSTKYVAGEEVVVVLDGLSVRRQGSGESVPAASLPAWTIALVEGVVQAGGATTYRLAFALWGEPFTCDAPDRSIEGTA